MVTLQTMNRPLSKELFEGLSEGLEMFGTRTYFDKGPEEVMALDDHRTKLRAAGVEETVLVLRDLVRDPKYGIPLVSGLLLGLQDWDELWDTEAPELEHL